MQKKVKKSPYVDAYPITSTGRHKKASTVVQLLRGKGEFLINGMYAFQYMQDKESYLFAMLEPLHHLQLKDDFNVNVRVQGGGLVGQVKAIRLGVARAICAFDETYHSALKRKGFLTRDPRCKERKKYGLKKARKAPQFSKR